MGRKGKRSDLPRPRDRSEALAAFDERFEAGDMETALAIADGALRRFADDASLSHARGLALWGLERFQSAAEAIARAAELDPALPDPHLDLATLLIDHLGYAEDALRQLKPARRAMTTPELQAALHALCGRAWLALEEPRSAEKEMRRARKLAPEDAELAAELAEVLVEALDFDGARRSLDEALQLEPELARAHWLKAVLLDREGDGDAAALEFEAAARIDPEGCFVPERLDEAEFDRQVEKALAGIPPRFRRHLENAEIAVEGYPSERFARDHRVSPLLLGLFVGTPLSLRSFDHADLPPRILVFQRNLENLCRSRRELVREIGITVRHEIGHLLGMEEEELEDAGHA